MTTKRIVSTLAVLGALTVAGCGSSDSSDSTSAPAASAPAASTSTPAAAAGGSVAIGMKNIAFDPKAVTVKVGQKIVWTNDEGVDHNVTADSGADFASSNFGEGKTFDYTPTKAGTIQYECTIHPGMVGTITVTK
jgi:plastocyanin